MSAVGSRGLKLRKKPKVVLVKRANVVDVNTRTHHHGALHTPAECEPIVLFWIDASSFQYIWVHHAGAAKLEPTLLTQLALHAIHLACAIAHTTGHIEFETWLRETKMIRTQPVLIAKILLTASNTLYSSVTARNHESSNWWNMKMAGTGADNIFRRNHPIGIFPIRVLAIDVPA